MLEVKISFCKMDEDLRRRRLDKAQGDWTRRVSLGFLPLIAVIGCFAVAEEKTGPAGKSRMAT